MDCGPWEVIGAPAVLRSADIPRADQLLLIAQRRPWSFANWDGLRALGALGGYRSTRGPEDRANL